jgi:hypothetical protein
MTTHESPLVLPAAARAVLLAIAALSFLGLNGVFCYYAFFRWPDFLAAFQQPITTALMVEAFLVTGLLAFFVARHTSGRWGWKGFVALSLLGGLGFSIPVYLLIHSKARS